MQAEMGKRFECTASGAQYLITKGGSGELSCVEAQDHEANQLGKRYQHQETGVVVLCTKAGQSCICCNLAPMELMAAKSLPSSD